MAGLLAVLLAGLVAATTLRFATFVPWGTDAPAYVEAAHRWADGRLSAPSPLGLWASWAWPPQAVLPLGQRPGLATGTDVSEYPAGLPLLMAAALLLAGELGPFLVAPLCAGLLVLCTYGLARRIAGPWLALLAAASIGITPATTGMAVQPMSDVPMTALWVLAWLMSLRPGTAANAAAGAAAAGAVLVRPNTAPLAGIVVLLVLCSRPGGVRSLSAWRSAAVTAALLALGPGLVMWTQTALYGGPFQTGYIGGWDWMFASAHIPKNLVLIPGFLMLLHSPAIFLGLLAPLLLALAPRRDDVHPQARLVAWSALAFAVVNLLIYLPYWPYEDPAFVRFQLPALAALFVLLAGMSHLLWHWLRRRVWVGLAALSVLPALFVAVAPGSWLRYPLTIRDEQQRAALMGRYLREVAPANGVILAHLQGGTLAHYTKLPVVRLDVVPGDALDAIIADLIAHGYDPLLVLGDGDEAATFATRFPHSTYRGLEWPRRAQAIDVTGLSYYRIADQRLFAAHQRWPVDVLRTHD
ncbi:MAG: glycosyltransferase family 39 protein [Acidobacteria bacterium]|nr:glycosyltransferase family 39 protein [Acidobacteriota bacterium]